ncbi:MAG: hypothetical protein OEN50_18480 [Deltaproteobacteria bacterium]|nr:hypothetical protein [Deltaproteobacteria bacterium]
MTALIAVLLLRVVGLQDGQKAEYAGRGQGQILKYTQVERGRRAHGGPNYY